MPGTVAWPARMGGSACNRLYVLSIHAHEHRIAQRGQSPQAQSVKAMVAGRGEWRHPVPCLDPRFGPQTPPC